MRIPFEGADLATARRVQKLVVDKIVFNPEDVGEDEGRVLLDPKFRRHYQIVEDMQLTDLAKLDVNYPSIVNQMCIAAEIAILGRETWERFQFNKDIRNRTLSMMVQTELSGK